MDREKSAVESLLLLGQGAESEVTRKQQTIMSKIRTLTLEETPDGAWVIPNGQKFVLDENNQLVPQEQHRSVQGAQASGNVQIVKVGANIGALECFNPAMDWNIYCERLEQYFHANGVSAESRVSVLITTIGLEVYKTLRDLCHPVLPQNKAYAELCDIMKKHFSSQISVFHERKRFYQLRQEPFESVSQWYARVKKGAVNCEFENELEGRIKDIFVAGMKEGKIIDRIMEESHQASLRQLLEMALRKEASLAASGISLDGNQVNKIAARRPNSRKGGESSGQGSTSEAAQQQAPKQKQQKHQEPTCKACGGTRHNFAQCRYKSYKCKGCHEVGHLVKVCKNKNSNNFVEEEERDDASNSDESFSDIYNVKYVVKVTRREPPVEVEVTIAKRKVLMEIDSGAALSVIPIDVYESRLSHCKLEKCDRILRLYGNHATMLPLGEIHAEVEYANKKAECTFVIVDGRKMSSLLGRDAMKGLGFYVGGINSVNDINVNLDGILKKYSNLFDGQLGRYTGEKVQLKLKNEVKPIFKKPHTIPFAFKAQVEQELDRLEKDAIIVKVNTSEWGTPLVPILKENGAIRVCANYRLTVNKHLEDFNHPIPRIEEMFVALQGGEEFSLLDLDRAYNQLELTEDTKKLLAWSTHRGVYLMNRLPFGTKPACSIFQQTLEKVLQGTPGCKNYFDDIIITGRDRNEHMKNLDLVLQKLQAAGFKLNLGKCKFFKKSVEYLGHVIDKKGIHKNPKKIEAIVNAPRPAKVDELQAYIGMVNYYAKFIPNLATMLNPMYKLLQKDVEFVWSKECQKAWEEVKAELVSDRNLVHFDPNVQIKLTCDASNVGLGVVLSHIYKNGEVRPISFASRTLSKAEKNYSVIHKEALAIYWGVTKFYQYLKGTQFLLETDHKPLLASLGEEKGIPQMAAGRLQRWAHFLSGFNYTLQYVKGSRNGVADGLSRLPLESKIVGAEPEYDYLNFVIDSKLPVDSKQIAKYTRTDLMLSKVYRYVKYGWPDEVDESVKPFASRAHELCIDQDVLMWGYRVIVPDKLKQDLLDEVHSTHMGSSKMKAVARQYFWWPNLDKELEQFAKSCEICNTFANNPERAELVRYTDSKEPLERIHMDFLGPIYNKCYLIVIDSYSKWPVVYEMGRMDAAATVKCLCEYVSNLGLPQKIVTDNGRQFVSEEFKNFCEANKINHVTTAPYHPSTNGAAENAVKSFKVGLKKAILDPKNSKIDTKLLIAKYLFTYRTTPHSVTEQTPAYLMYGRQLRTRFDALRENVCVRNKNRQVANYPGKRNVEFELGQTLKDGLYWKRHLDQMRSASSLFEKFCENPEHKKTDAMSSEMINFPLPQNIEPQEINPSISCGDTPTVWQRKEEGVYKPIEIEEYVAMSDASQELIGLENSISIILSRTLLPADLWCDNKADEASAKIDGVKRLRHMTEIKAHYVEGCTEKEKKDESEDVKEQNDKMSKIEKRLDSMFKLMKRLEKREEE
ncbi:uncharacterized protein K02A2.6-like [Copidosoma floridanum]|uniref:uncharacterized protein K02A2.6-like n=1 Tax=Copidosoma floridanum TaxID=29053 RepID=UPI000C6FBC6A|nr:uncharacterized protein K02A2.6-like [Copidosoma floridanum]